MNGLRKEIGSKQVNRCLGEKSVARGRLCVKHASR